MLCAISKYQILTSCPPANTLLVLVLVVFLLPPAVATGVTRLTPVQAQPCTAHLGHTMTRSLVHQCCWAMTRSHPRGRPSHSSVTLMRPHRCEAAAQGRPLSAHPAQLTSVQLGLQAGASTTTAAQHLCGCRANNSLLIPQQGCCVLCLCPVCCCLCLAGVSSHPVHISTPASGQGGTAGSSSTCTRHVTCSSRCASSCSAGPAGPSRQPTATAPCRQHKQQHQGKARPCCTQYRPPRPTLCLAFSTPPRAVSSAAAAATTADLQSAVCQDTSRCACGPGPQPTCVCRPVPADPGAQWLWEKHPGRLLGWPVASALWQHQLRGAGPCCCCCRWGHVCASEAACSAWADP